MQVVTEKLELPPLTLQNPDGKRLMTVDIGTTTIAMQLYDMTGKVVDSFPSVNPQVSYGADVLSRIEAAKSFIDLSISSTYEPRIRIDFLMLCANLPISSSEWYSSAL